MRAEAEVVDFAAKEAARESEHYAADQERQRQTAVQEQEESEKDRGLVDTLVAIVIVATLFGLAMLLVSKIAS